MLRRGLIAAWVGARLVGAAGVLAQDDAPSFGTVTLDSNFLLDPFVITVIGGGTVAAAELGEDCAGYVPAAPTLTLTLSGEPTEGLRVFAYSDADPVLVVQTPDGEVLCNDDSNALVVDPTVEIELAGPGDYRIWLGMYAQNQLSPAFLIVTHSAQVTASLFTVDTLVQRVPASELEANLTAEIEANLQAQIAAGVRQTTGAAATATLDPAGEPLEIADAVGGGALLALETDSRGYQCAGYIAPQPTLNLTVPADTPALHVLFESTIDTTLVIVAPNGDVFCNDDQAGANLNPGVLIDAPAAGGFAIYVGTFDPATTAEGVLRVGATDTLEAAVLEAPPAPAAGQ